MDTRIEETLEELEAVLNRLPDVDVVRKWATAARVDIDLTVASFESLRLLTYCAEGANVRFESWPARRPGSREAQADPASAMVHRYSVGCDEGSEDTLLENMRVLGAFLVWKSHSAGYIETDGANRLLDLWKAVRVPRPQRHDPKEP